MAQLPVSLQTGLDGGLTAPRDPADTSPLLFWGRFNSAFPSQQRPDAESQPAGRAGRAAAAEFGAVPDAGALQHLRGERGVPKNRGQRAVIPHQRGFPARGRVPELLLAVPTHRTWWQGLGYHHHHLPLPAGDQQTAVPSRAAPGPGAALPLGGTVSAGGSFLPQTDAAMSQSFPAGANKPLLHLGQVFVCPFHTLLSPLKVIFPSIIHFFSPRKKKFDYFSLVAPRSVPKFPISQAIPAQSSATG